MTKRNIELTATIPIKTPQNDEEIIALATQKKAERLELGFIDRRNYPLALLRFEIAGLVSANSYVGLSPEEIHLATVPAKHKGDYALQIPHLMKEDMKTYRSEILPTVKRVLEESNMPFSNFTMVGPFLNIDIQQVKFTRLVLNSVLKFEKRYGEIDLGKNKNATVEYSSPNVGKSLHVGHLGTTLLGHIYANILFKAGFCTYRINHLGDWGLPIGLLKVAIEEFGEEAQYKEKLGDTADYFASLYARIHAESENNPELRTQAQEKFALLEKKDPEMLAFWKDICERSILVMEKFYKYFDITFDAFIGEAYYEADLENICKKIATLDRTREDGNALVVDFDDKNLGTVLVKKSDGATTYIARDLAAIVRRHKIFNYDYSYYVVGSEQTAHFRQLFEITKELGESYAENCKHIPIGLLQQGGKKISSRKGTALTPDELLDATIEGALNIVKKSLEELSLEEQKSIAYKIGTAAMLYTQVLTTPGKNIEFNLERMLDLKGKTGPYLQYTAVRGKSVLKKVGEPTMNLSEISDEVIAKADEACTPLLKQIAVLPETLESCFEASSPHPLAHYLHELAQAINQLYQTVRFKDAKGELKEFYLLLVKSAVITLENGLEILNIEVPEQM